MQHLAKLSTPQRPGKAEDNVLSPQLITGGGAVTPSRPALMEADAEAARSPGVRIAAVAGAVVGASLLAPVGIAAAVGAGVVGAVSSSRGRYQKEKAELQGQVLRHRRPQRRMHAL